MGTKVKETCTVLSQECIGKDIYSMWIQTKTIAGNARPGYLLVALCVISEFPRA